MLDNMRTWARLHYVELLNAARRAQGTVSDSPGSWALGAVLASLLIMLAANARRLWNLYRMRHVATHPENCTARQRPLSGTAVRLKVLAKRGWKKSEMQTASEFLGYIDDVGHAGSSGPLHPPL